MMTLLVVTLALAMIAATPEVFGPDATHAHTDQLAFVSEHDGTPQVFLINTDGTGRRRLTGPPGRSTTPVWSPDGRRIAFVRQLGDDMQIYVMNADGRSKRPLTPTPGTHTSPAWSPDGRQIVYVSARDGPPQISVVRGDGGDAQALTRAPGERRAPAWSSDGRLIAFLSKETTGFFDLFVMGADGRGRRPVPTRSPGVEPEVTGFVWLPDGRIAYTKRSGPAQQVVTITTIDGARQEFLGSAYSPTWAPDGHRVAFVVSHVGSAQIYVRDTSDGMSGRLTDPRVISVRPAWSPDGRRIAFLVIDRGVVALTVMNANGTGAHALASVYGDLSAPSIFAWRP